MRTMDEPSKSFEPVMDAALEALRLDLTSAENAIEIWRSFGNVGRAELAMREAIVEETRCHVTRLVAIAVEYRRRHRDNHARS